MRVTYELLTEPGPTGQRLWAELTLANHSGLSLSGESAGEVIVTHSIATAQQPPDIEWGGSSADSIGVKPHAVSTKKLYTIAGRKLDARTESRVALFGVSTYLSSTEVDGCRLAAHMRAPSGLVLHHPPGRWFLPADRGDRIRVDGLLAMS